jgi:ParB-like chromosome segregation protein Spo0J
MIVHEIADCYGMMDDKSFGDFKKDIAENGQMQPIVMYEDILLDGRHRLRACEELGIKPDFKQLPKGIDLITYIRSMNTHRRHETAEQRALSAAKLHAWLQQNRKQAAKDKLPLPKEVTIADVADSFNITPRSVDRARTVKNSNLPGLEEAVSNGRISLSDAADLVTKFKDKDEALELLSKGKEAVRRAIKPTVADYEEPEQPIRKEPKAGSINQAGLLRKQILKQIEQTTRLVDEYHNQLPNQFCHIKANDGLMAAWNSVKGWE